MKTAIDTALAFHDAVRAFERELDPYRNLTIALAEQFQASDLVRGITAAQSLLAESEIIRNLKQLRTFASSPAWVDQYAQIGRVADAAVGALADAFSSVHLDSKSTSQLQSDLQTWVQLASAGEEHSLGARSLGWQIAVHEGLRLSELPSGKALAPHVLRPATMLTRLARKTARRITRTTDSTTRGRLEASIEIVEAQVAGQLSGLETQLADSTIEADDEDFAPDRRILLANREQIEMVAAPPETPLDAATLAAASSGVAVHALARDVLTLTFGVNQARRIAGRENIFKLTNRLLQAAVNLPWMDVTSEQTLGPFIDDLYFLLYEGAGKDHLRFLKAHGGPLEESACGVVFTVKHLRNKWLRHDPEHGDESAVRKSYDQLRERLRELGVSGMPRRQYEFRVLQRRLLEDVRTFLDRLRDSISSQA